MSKRNLQRAARTIQAQCGVSYTAALQWARENSDAILKEITRDDGSIMWKEYGAAAAGLWRRAKGC